MLKVRVGKFVIVVAIALIQCSLSLTYGQIGIGQWRVHYPYVATHSVVDVDNKIYTASNFVVYYYDKQDGSLNVMSKIEGLYGAEINKIGSYNGTTAMVGYVDGSIDMISPGGEITKFNDIQRSLIIGSKSINHFLEVGSNMILSTDYGMSIINMSKKEVSDSYINISSDGSSNPFYGSVLSRDEDSIFVVAEKGVMAARYSSGVNLKDFSNWNVYGLANGLPAGKSKTIGRVGETIYVGVDDFGLYYFNGTSWAPTSIVGATGSMVRSIISKDNCAYVSLDQKIYKVVSPTLNTMYSGSDFLLPNEVIPGNNSDLWVSDGGYGLIHYVNGQTFITRPNGPISSDVYRLKFIENKVYACPGGLSNSFGPLYIDGGVMFFSQDEQWRAYTKYDYLPDTRDLLDITYQSVRSKWYFSTFGFGLIEGGEGGPFTLLTKSNSPLKSNQTSGLATDKKGTVWVGATSENIGDPFLYSIDKAGVWQSYFPFQNNGRYPLDILIDANSRKWIRLATSGGKKGLMLFDETNNSQIYFTESNGSGQLPTVNVNAIEEDREGQIWIGTDEGIGVFTNPSQIKPGNSIPNIYRPIVGGFPLFFDKKINCIKADGGNRKWVGTPDGVFLLSADGLTTISHFTSANSPLPNDNIITITIDEQSGEVFFGTDKGIISFRGDATRGEKSYQEVKIFPNPVRPGFEGLLGISGLTNNAVVKITDSSGRLVYETNANGSTATWNLKSYNGKRASAGIYLVFSASSDGSEKHVGKFAIVE